MSDWASIIYTRPLDAALHGGYQFIASPEGFDKDDMYRVAVHVLATLQSEAMLRNSPRWTLFSNGKYCIFGMSCVASEISQKERVAFERGACAFVGYVANLTEGNPAIRRQIEIPSYSTLNNHVREFFSQSFEECLSQAEANAKIYKSSYKSLPLFEESELTYSIPINSEIILLQEASKNNERKLWQDSKTNRQKLWELASYLISRSGHSTSLHLGLPSKDYAFRVPFLNSTTFDVPNDEDGIVLEECGEQLRQEDQLEIGVPRQQSNSGEDFISLSQRSNSGTSFNDTNLLDNLKNIDIVNALENIDPVGVVVGGLTGIIFGALSSPAPCVGAAGLAGYFGAKAIRKVWKDEQLFNDRIEQALKQPEQDEDEESFTGQDEIDDK
jgi:hypothetical protein